MSVAEVILSIAVIVITIVLLIGHDGYKNTGKWWG